MRNDTTLRIPLEPKGNSEVSVVVDLEGRESATVRLERPNARPSLSDFLVGRPCDQAADICARLCSTDSVPMMIAALSATEDAFNIEVEPAVLAMRELLIRASIIQEHMTHLFFSAIPLHRELSGALEFASEEPALFERALSIKELSRDLFSIVGGRTTYPMTLVPDGFSTRPDRLELERLAGRLEAAVHDCEEIVDLVASYPLPDFQTDGDFVALYDLSTYSILGDNARVLLSPWQGSSKEFSESVVTAEEDDFTHISLADGNTFMCGALARLNHSWSNFATPARIAAAKVALRPVCLNPFRNEVSEAIETVDAVCRCSEICHELASTDSPVLPGKVAPCGGSGFSSVETAQGTIFMTLSFDDMGSVTDARALLPSTVNLSNMMSDIRKCIASSDSADTKTLKRMITGLICAYDISLPCISS